MVEKVTNRADYGPLFNALSKARMGDNRRLNEEVVSAFLAFDSSLAPVYDVTRASLIEKCLDLYSYSLGDVFQLTSLNKLMRFIRVMTSPWTPLAVLIL